MKREEKIEKIEKIEKVVEKEEMFELTWDTISKSKVEQQARNIKASHEVRGDMVEGDFDFE